MYITRMRVQFEILHENSLSHEAIDELAQTALDFSTASEALETCLSETTLGPTKVTSLLVREVLSSQECVSSPDEPGLPEPPPGAPTSN